MQLINKQCKNRLREANKIVICRYINKMAEYRYINKMAECRFIKQDG